jgi:hypothetical protein
MMITTLSSREFNQNASEAKKAANQGPVFITDRGVPAHVLISIDLYHELVSDQKKITDLLGMQDEENFEFEIPRRSDLAQAADLE